MNDLSSQHVLLFAVKTIALLKLPNTESEIKTQDNKINPFKMFQQKSSSLVFFEQ